MTDSELLKRLEKLERDNRRLKRLGVAALVLVGALGLVAAARPIPNVIKAHEFEVVDAAGRGRIQMAVGPQQQGANVRLFDASGRMREDLEVNNTGTSSVSLFDARNHAAVWMMHVAAANQVAMQGGSDDNVAVNEVVLAAPTTRAGSLQGIGMSVQKSGEPRITLLDPQGFEMDLGSTSTQTIGTGATQQTSADSIVMFGNDKERHVIWQAP